MTRFSIIAVDYEHHVPRDGMRRGLQSVAAQTFSDFELMLCHDGPKDVPYCDEVDLVGLGIESRTHTCSLEQRANDWGHSCRDHLMRLAQGEWFLQFNCDNVLHPRCLERLDAFIQTITERIIIFKIWHHKLRRELTGLPPKVNDIDALQLVARRDLWSEIGYWHDNRWASDGYIYEDMCRHYPYAVLDERLAENF